MQNISNRIFKLQNVREKIYLNILLVYFYCERKIAKKILCSKHEYNDETLETEFLKFRSHVCLCKKTVSLCYYYPRPTTIAVTIQ